MTEGFIVVFPDRPAAEWAAAMNPGAAVLPLQDLTPPQPAYNYESPQLPGERLRPGLVGLPPGYPRSGQRTGRPAPRPRPAGNSFGPYSRPRRLD